MSSLSSYVGIVFALLIGTIAGIFSTNASGIVPAYSPIPLVASSTHAVPAVQKSIIPAVKSKQAPAILPASTSTAETAVPAPVPSGDAALNDAASVLRAALVNIMCYAPAASPFHSISGSGVFIDSKGIVLTNAHVAQYFLLADRGVSCTIRTGSPAADQYKAALIYISPLWINANAGVLTQAAPLGTGEYDFALLAVTASATTNPLPVAFPSIPLAETPPVALTPVVIASYGAQFLQIGQIQSSLFPTIVFGSVKDIFTFEKNTVDVLDLGGSAAAQEGSSGGGVASAAGELIGTITTSTISGATDTRSLDAITASYIRGEYASEMDAPIDNLLNEPTATAVDDFASRIPLLESIITAHTQ